MVHPLVVYLGTDEAPPAGQILPVYALTDGFDHDCNTYCEALPELLNLDTLAFDRPADRDRFVYFWLWNVVAIVVGVVLVVVKG